MPDPMVHYIPGYIPTKNYSYGMYLLSKMKYNDALNILLWENTSSQCYGLAQCNAALISIQLGHYVKAELYSSIAIKEFEAYCPHPPSYVQALRNYAEAQMFQGKLTESLGGFEKAIIRAHELVRTYPKHKDEIEIQTVHMILSKGNVYLLLEEYNSACEQYAYVIRLYKKKKANEIGIAQVLANYGHSLAKLGKLIFAERVILLSLKFAEAQNDDDQIDRSTLALIGVNPTLFSLPEVDIKFKSAIKNALNAKRYSTAYLRCCIYATFLIDHELDSNAKDIINYALTFDGKLDRMDYNRPKLRYMYAKLKGVSADDKLKHLVNGAQLWYKMLANKIPSDFSRISEEFHDHFRLLSLALLEANRNEESLTAFELGRTLSYMIECDPQLQSIITNLKIIEDDKLNLSIIKKLQRELKDNEVILVIASLPPIIICYMVFNNRIEIIDEKLTNDIEELKDIEESLKLVSEHLFDGLGDVSIADPFHNLAKSIVQKLGNSVIVKIAPYASLHNIPWRILLNYHGIKWEQLFCSTNFGLMIPSLKSTREVNFLRECIGLSYGSITYKSYTYNLAEETDHFISNFKKNSHVRDCSKEQVVEALKKEAVVFLSCHGRKNKDDYGISLTLSDGVFNSYDLFPNKINARIIILSACESGFYYMSWGDYPVGAAPELLKSGALFCIGARFPINAYFSDDFFKTLSLEIVKTKNLVQAFSNSLSIHSGNYNLWDNLACLEILSIN
jgi:hypothetical protein